MGTRKFAADERLTDEQKKVAEELYPLAIRIMHKTLCGFDARFREEFEAPTAVACCQAVIRWRPDRGGSIETYLFNYVRGYCLSYYNRHAKMAWTRMKTRTIGNVDRKNSRKDHHDGDAWLDPPARPGPEPVVSQDTLEPYLKFLDPRSRRLLEMRFALDMTLQECATEFGISAQRVKQITDAAIVKLRAAIERTPNVGSRKIAVFEWTGD